MTTKNNSNESERIAVLENEIKHISSSTDKIDDMDKRISELTTAIESVKTEIASVKTDIARLILLLTS